jgi:predicted nicotinamide N-methyase
LSTSAILAIVGRDIERRHSWVRGSTPWKVEIRGRRFLGFLFPPIGFSFLKDLDFSSIGFGNASTGFVARRDFILANTRLIAPPLTPGIRLWLADEAVPLWKKTEEELGAIGLPPPFWAFAWAGGQALARYVLDNPVLVAGRRALDFASGSGLVAIAAALSGAAAVEASDIDAFAVAAIEANAAENRASVAPRLENLIGADEGWEVVLAGDMAYEKDLAEAAMDWLERLARRGAAVLIGDPRRAYLPRERLDCVIEYGVPVTRELEDSEIKRTGVFRFR